MTADEFTKHEQNRTDLHNLLANPILSEALNILMNELQPTRGGEAEGNPVVSAARYQQLAGANHIMFGLRRLTQAPRVPTGLKGKQLLPDPNLN